MPDRGPHYCATRAVTPIGDLQTLVVRLFDRRRRESQHGRFFVAEPTNAMVSAAAPRVGCSPADKSRTPRPLTDPTAGRAADMTWGTARCDDRTKMIKVDVRGKP
jgi:hypothetical protein